MLPSLQPVNAHALEFNLPAIAGLGEKPAAVKAVLGLVPTVVGIVLEKSINAEGETFVKESCACTVFPAKMSNEQTAMMIAQTLLLKEPQ